MMMMMMVIFEKKNRISVQVLLSAFGEYWRIWSIIAFTKYEHMFQGWRILSLSIAWRIAFHNQLGIWTQPRISCGEAVARKRPPGTTAIPDNAMHPSGLDSWGLFELKFMRHFSKSVSMCLCCQLNYNHFLLCLPKKRFRIQFIISKKRLRCNLSASPRRFREMKTSNSRRSSNTPRLPAFVGEDVENPEGDTENKKFRHQTIPLARHILVMYMYVYIYRLDIYIYRVYIHIGLPVGNHTSYQTYINNVYYIGWRLAW